VLFLAFVIALAITAALIPFLARWAPAIGLTDAPGPRKVHAVPVPRVGGLAMGIGLLIPTLMTVQLTRAALGLLVGILVLLLFGLWDDAKNLGYRTKLAGQVIAVALCMSVGGLRIGTLYFGGVEIFPTAVNTFLTFAFLVGVTNAVNLADGLDGLAGGLVLLCLSAIALFAASTGNHLVTTVVLIEAGAILGFLRFNTHPARIFMGDSGSQVLGFSVGALALQATHGQASGLSAALPLLLLGLPIVDTLAVMLTRIRAGRSPFSADSNHLHHRLLNLGFAHREAVLLIYVAQAALVLLAYFLRFEADLTIILAFCVFAALVLGFLRWASYSGWRVRARGSSSPARILSDPTLQSLLPTLTLVVITTCLLGYAATVVATRPVGVDVGLLCLAMLIPLTVLGPWKARGPLQWFERAAAYIGVVTLVYLDQTSPEKPALLTTLSWTLIAVTGVAAVIRFSLSPTRRFEVTTLDLLVVFIALVVPNLPGSVTLPPDLPAGVAKTVILMYVIEMLLTTDLKRLMPRVILILMLAGIAGRALLGTSI
jgi:UDP-GlcNAc:undecaprenyl-phosphate GlcNAc-1-phosphate transferase